MHSTQFYSLLHLHQKYFYLENKIPPPPPTKQKTTKNRTTKKPPKSPSFTSCSLLRIDLRLTMHELDTYTTMLHHYVTPLCYTTMLHHYVTPLLQCTQGWSLRGNMLLIVRLKGTRYSPVGSPIRINSTLIWLLTHTSPLCFIRKTHSDK